ncbi:Fam213a [Columba livia]|nr:Fam213a [Columba livia]
MSFLPDFGIFTMGMWSIGLGAIGAAVTGIVLANTDLFLSKPEKATLEFLEEIDLKSLGTEFFVGVLSSENDLSPLKEASELSSLKPQLSKLGVPLYAVVKEKIGTEVEDFQHYFKGEIFLDEKKGFYGPHRRKMMLSGFFRFGVWQNFFRAWKNGYSGNLEGEGFTLGGVFVIGAGRQGVLLEHREKEFGDKVSLPSVLEAAEKIKPQAS